MAARSSSSRSRSAKAPARIIAVANQKGGVGKSTTAVSLGAALAEIGKKVLVVDLDPQGNASTGLGIRHEARQVTVYDVLVGEAGIETAVVMTQIAGLSAVPSNIDLAGAEIELVSQFSRELRLKKALEPLAQDGYDFVLLDCPPSLGLLTVNALAAALELIVPIQCEYYALEGLGQLLRNVRLVQQNLNPSLQLTGIVMTMYDPRTRLSEQVVDEVRRYFGDRVYDVVIPRTVRLSEAPGFGQPITVYDPRSKGAECYRELAKEVAEKLPPSTPMPSFDDLPTVVVGPPEPERSEGSPQEGAAGAEVVQNPEVEAASGRAAVETEREPTPDDEPQAPVAQASSGSTQEPSPDQEQVKSTAPEAEEPAAERPEPPIAGPLPPDEDEIWEVDDRPEGSRRPAPPPAQEPPTRVVVIEDDSVSVGSPGVTSPGNIGATLREEPRRRRFRLFRKGGE